MMSSLGKRQLRLLSALAAPTMSLVVGDTIARSLQRRGLVEAKGEDGDSFFCITPAGLRRVADELEAGRVKAFDPATRRRVKEENKSA